MPEKSTCDNCDQPAVLHTVKTVGDDGLGTMDICDPCEDSQYDDLIAEPKPERKPERTNEPLALVVNKANLAIARLVEKVPESRYALRSLNLTDKHTEVTDGHMAVRVSLPNVAMVQLPEIPACPVSPREGFKPFAIDATDAKKIEAIIPAHRSLSILNYAHVNVGDNGTAQFATTELDREPTPDGNGELIAPTIDAGKIENQFPPIDKVIPKKKAKLEIGFDAELLANVLKSAAAFKKFDDKKAKTFVRLSFVDATTAVRIECANDSTGQTFYALVMPCRI